MRISHIVKRLTRILILVLWRHYQFLDLSSQYSLAFVWTKCRMEEFRLKAGVHSIYRRNEFYSVRIHAFYDILFSDLNHVVTSRNDSISIFLEFMSHTNWEFVLYLESWSQFEYLKVFLAFFSVFTANIWILTKK